MAEDSNIQVCVFVFTTDQFPFPQQARFCVLPQHSQHPLSSVSKSHVIRGSWFVGSDLWRPKIYVTLSNLSIVSIHYTG
jgi:hypothetical protein